MPAHLTQALVAKMSSIADPKIALSGIRRQRVNRMRGFRHWRWYLDEMYVKLNGEMLYLWRAVDQKVRLR